jgi:hypothetical protein
MVITVGHREDHYDGDWSHACGIDHMHEPVVHRPPSAHGQPGRVDKPRGAHAACITSDGRPVSMLYYHLSGSFEAYQGQACGIGYMHTACNTIEGSGFKVATRSLPLRMIIKPSPAVESTFQYRPRSMEVSRPTPTPTASRSRSLAPSNPKSKSNRPSLQTYPPSRTPCTLGAASYTPRTWGCPC